jgi:hypothetical protein
MSTKTFLALMWGPMFVLGSWFGRWLMIRQANQIVAIHEAGKREALSGPAECRHLELREGPHSPDGYATECARCRAIVKVTPRPAPTQGKSP